MNHDQFEAAIIEARLKCNQALGLPSDHRGTTESSPFAEELFDLHADDSRCQHLAAVPVQPWYWTAAAGWLCGPCTRVASGRAHALGPAKVHALAGLEDFICDGCRRYVAGALQSAVIRIGHVIMACGLCDDCVRRATARKDQP